MKKVNLTLIYFWGWTSVLIKTDNECTSFSYTKNIYVPQMCFLRFHLSISLPFFSKTSVKLFLRKTVLEFVNINERNRRLFWDKFAYQLIFLN